MKKILTVILGLTAIAFVVSVMLTQLHYGLAQKGFDQKSFCNLSEVIDCDTVVASRFSSVRTPWMSVPNSELGLLYYALLAGALLYAAFASEKNRRATLAFFFITVVLANLYSVAMAYISLRILGVVCVLCLTTYVANFLILLLFPSAMGVGWSGLMGELKTHFRERFLLNAVVCLVALIGGLIFFRGLNPMIHRPHVEVSREAYLAKFRSTERFDIDVTGHPVWGNPQGKIRIVEFSDFQCPYCKKAAFTLKPYLKSLPAAVRDEIGFYFSDYPLDAQCNPVIPQGQGHQFACIASKAAACAGAQGHFWEYHDLLFQNQPRLSRPLLSELAAQAKLDTAAFEGCLVSEETDRALKSKIEAGSKLTIEGTPTIFINGRRFLEWPDPERLRLVVEGEMKN